MNEKMSFEVGQIVRLKSGGPNMTVKSKNTNLADKVVGYSCQWFAGKKLESGSFPISSIELIEPENGR